MAQSEFKPPRPVMSEEVIQNILDAFPIIPKYVRELKRQISTLQESNEMMESRILQLEKQLGKTRRDEGLTDHLPHDSLSLSSRQTTMDLFSYDQ